MQLLPEIFLILRRIEPDMTNNVYYNCALLDFYRASSGNLLITIGAKFASTSWRKPKITQKYFLASK